jgi:hypothetical protein
MWNEYQDNVGSEDQKVLIETRSDEDQLYWLPWLYYNTWNCKTTGLLLFDRGCTNQQCQGAAPLVEQDVIK